MFEYELFQGLELVWRKSFDSDEQAIEEVKKTFCETVLGLVLYKKQVIFAN